MKEITSHGHWIFALFLFGVTGCSSATDPQSSDELDTLSGSKTFEDGGGGAHDGGGIERDGGGGAQDGGGIERDGGGGAQDAGIERDGGGGAQDAGIERDGGGGASDAGGYECDRAKDCVGPLPQYCVMCVDDDGGSEACAHWACIRHQCEIVTCE